MTQNEKSGFENVEKQLKDLEKQEKIERDRQSVQEKGFGAKEGRSLFERNKDALEKAKKEGKI